TSYDPEFLQTQAQIITSLPVAKKVVRQLNLDQTYDRYVAGRDESGFSVTAVVGWIKGLYAVVAKITNNVFAKPVKTLQEIEEQEISRADLIAEMIRSSVTVEPLEETKIVNVSFMSANPELALIIANATAKAYIDQLLEMKLQASNYNRKWMGIKGEEEAGKLKKAKKALNEYMKANDIVTIEDRATIIPQKLAQLSTGLAQAETRQKELETLYAKIRRSQNNYEELETIPVIADDSVLKLIRDQILKVEQNIMEQSNKYGPKHPVMDRVNSELAILKTKRNQEIRHIIRTVKNRYELANSNTRDLREMLDNTKKQAVNLNEKFIQYEILRREIENHQNLFNALTSKADEQSITEKAQNINVWVVEKAQLPDFPSKPNRKRNILLGIIMGLFGGVGLALFLEYLDNTIKTPDDVEDKYNLPVLTTVSKIKDKTKTLYKLVLDEPSSAFAESFKSLRASIMLSSSDSPPKTILITSMAPKDGKTTIASNLAMAIAGSGSKVLIIDCDLRRPMLHQVFGLENKTGLSTFISGTSGITIIRDGLPENLSIIPSGPIPPNPSELMISKRLKDLIRSLKNKYDFIIFDTPPIISVSDTLIISKIVDASLIVTRFGKTTYEMMSYGMKQLAGIEAKVIGTVINAVDEKKSGYYYYHYNKEYYQYYSSNNQE
ncbi:MAG: polysaccharide biosynthesis tyrosine autokinase, partial [Deltaproteobacteria bacterium]|nr:polysaccharide biosynthesis tyrosine autokinase [Deltaproteobacteria bacterium]